MKKIATAAAAFLSAATMSFSAAAPAFSNMAVTNVSAADTSGDDWLHAEGSRLYDMNGNEVWLTGANWFGFNCTENVLHYLWSGDLCDMVKDIADHGINVLRIPVSTELLYNWMIGDPDPIESVNPNDDPYYPFNVALINKDGSVMNSQQVFNVLLEQCKKNGVKVFIDIHSPESNNSGHNYGLWYGKSFTANDGETVEVTTDVWMETLAWTADYYKNDDTLIGFDLKNEPHSKYGGAPVDAVWDNSTAENNWKNASEKCANAILEKNPHALIFIEGVEGYNGHGAWWGGNLRGVADYPVTPETGTSQIVYSPHDYGPIVSDQTWFNKDFTEETLLDDYWYDTWAYLVDKDVAPLLIGEWGGRIPDTVDEESLLSTPSTSLSATEKNVKWMILLRNYMINHHVSHTFWCLNDDSGDTGGLWKNIQYNPTTGTVIEWDTEKYKLFEPSLWQTLDSGKYIGLDHQQALGKNGISLNDFYGNYSSTEGSNIDGGKKSGGTPVVPDGTTTTDIKTTTATTTTSKTTSSSTATDSTTVSNIMYGDSNCDGKIDISDAVMILQAIANPDKYGVGGTDPTCMTAQGEKNADCSNVGDGVTAKDALAVQRYVVELITVLPEK